jgi:hypothetical protein
MKPFKKPYAHAVLKNLPEAKQQEIIDYANGTETSQPHKMIETVEWLKAAGIETSYTGLVNFRQWFMRCQQMLADEANSLQTVQLCKERGWIKTREEEEEAALIIFNRLTLDREDIRGWVLVQGVSLRRDRQELEERKFKLMQKREDKTKEVVQDVKMTPEEKEERIRQIMGLE